MKLPVSCPFCNEDMECTAVADNNLLNEVFELINRQKAEIKQKDTEIDILIRKKETLKDELAEKQAEIERLKGFRKEGFTNLLGNCLVYSKNLKDYNDMRKGLKAEARKEFAERLKEKAYRNNYCQDIVLVEDIDNLMDDHPTEKGGEQE